MRYQVRATPPPGDDENEFVMSDASVDRVGDVIEQNWELKNFRNHPIALFNHQRDQVIGRWADVKVKDGRLVGRLDFAEKGTSPLIDTIRELHRQKILRAVSVGFQPLKKEKLGEAADDYFGPFRFIKSELLECSLVSIPANPNALSTAKALGIPRDILSAVFREHASEDEPRGRASTGAHARAKHPSKASQMPPVTLSQKIQNAQKDVTRLKDQLAELIAKDEPDENETALIDELPGEIETAETLLKRYESVERAIAPKGGNGQQQRDKDKPVDGEVIPPGDRRAAALNLPKKKIEPADYLFRAMAVGVRSFTEQVPLDQALRNMYGNDEGLQIVMRAAVNPAMTSVAGWAAELVQTANGAFLDRIIQDSIYGPLSAMGQRYDLGRNGSLKIPTRASTPKAAGSWVGEGAPKPVKRIGFAPITLTPHKLAVISTFTEEMALYSTPAIEGILRQALTDDTSESLDGYLIDNVASSTSRPAGLLNGVTPIAASVLTPATVAMVADLKALVGAIVAAGGGKAIAILMNPAQAMSLGFAQTTTGDFMFESTDQAGNKFMARIIVSGTVPAGTVIALDAADFATATGDAPRFAISTEATLHEEDTTPLAIGSTGTPTVVAAPTRSLFQTDSVAIRLSLFVTWAMLRPGHVAAITGITLW